MDLLKKDEQNLVGPIAGLNLEYIGRGVLEETDKI
jgi:hypothetical protein